MRHFILALTLPLWLAACGDDGAKTADSDATGDDTSVPLDTNPDKDTPGELSGGNHPPELERIGDRSVAVGQTISITLSGKDSDSDKLTYSVFGNLPEGARFDKGEHRFEWAPTEANKTVFLTFVVSDGTDFDRETVRIQVTATATTNPPSFADVGDQTLPIDQPYTLTLVATDPDGDKLTYGHEGTLPNGATLDATTGVFSWRPGAADVGTPIRITFTVSDGSASDTLPVRFIVDDGGGQVGKPPQFTKIGPQTVIVGQTLTLTLAATDPNGDAITFSIQGQTPPGAALSGATFTFTPQASQVGQTVQVTFAANDGALSAVMTVDISVHSGQTATCTPDANEPNEDVATATDLPLGSRSATLCETETTYDSDTYKVTVPAGQELRAKLTFDVNLGDLDLALLDADENILTISEGVTGVEELRYASPGERQAYLIVFGYGLEPLALTYTLETSVAQAAVCTDDGYEQNDTPFDAKPLDDTAQAATHQICANDEDYWTLAVGCGARVEVIMDILGAADLDLYLFDDVAGDGAPVASAITEDPTESIDVPQAKKAGTWLLAVAGYPESAESGYQLIADVTGACSDDPEGGSSRATAQALSSGGGPFEALKICCSDDWFSFSLQAGDKVVVELGVASGSVGAVAYGSDGTTQIASKDPSPTGGILSFTATAAGSYFVKASGTVGTAYSFDWTITGAVAGCDLLSCDKYDNCNISNGQCELDPWCQTDGECPPSFVCRESYCVNPCQSAFECRDGYACKAFDDTPIATFCGATGPGVSGADCGAHADCADTLACIFDTHNGYCAAVGCALCPVDTQCATVGALSFCAKTCNTNADCREAEGYTCSAEKTCLPQNP